MPYLFVLAAIALRVLPHPWNVTPLGAMFLFSGATFRSKRDSLLVPLAALLISDYAVDHLLYHGAYAWFSPFTWGAFLLVGLIGWALRGRLSVARVAGASLTGSTLFFLVSNFGVWLGWSMYPPTLGGLTACYVAAIPFFSNTLLGDLAYAGVMFGTYAWLRHRRPAVAANAR
jgi:Family of unknown function (DUF6580)